MAPALSSVMAHTPWSALLPESEQIHLLPLTVSLTEFFSAWDSRAQRILEPLGHSEE